MFVQELRSNVKGGCTVRLGPLTLISGPNGAGKDTILQSLELALRARASDVAGKAEAGSYDLLEPLFPPAAEKLEVSAVLQYDNGAFEHATFSMPRGKRPKTSGPSALSFPLRDIREALETGSAERQQRTLFALLGAQEEKLLEKYGQWKVQVAETKKALTVVESGIQAVEPTVPLDIRSVEGLREALAGLEDRRHRFLQYQSVEQHAKAAQEQVETLLAKYREQTSQLAAVQDRLQQIARAQVADDEQAFLAVESLGKMLEVLQRTNATQCPCCSTVVSSGFFLRRAQEILPQVQNFREQRQAQMRDREEAARLTVEREYLQSQILETQRVGAEAVKRREEIFRLMEAQFPQIPGDPTDEIASIQRTLGSYDTASAARNRLSTLKAEARRLQGELATATTKLEEIEAQIRSELHKKLDAILESARKYCADILGGELILDWGTPETPKFRIGLQRKGETHFALSGAEWVVATTALALVAAERREGLSVVIPEERAFTVELLTRWMHTLALAKPRAQVILTTVLHVPEVPGWTMISLGEAVPESSPPQESVSVKKETTVSEGGAAPKKRGRPRKNTEGSVSSTPKISGEEASSDVPPGAVKPVERVEQGTGVNPSTFSTESRPASIPRRELGTGVWRGNWAGYKAWLTEQNPATAQLKIVGQELAAEGQWALTNAGHVLFISHGSVEVWLA